MQMKNIIIAVAALAVGAAAGWFAGGLGNGERGMGNGRARCPQRADGGGLGQAALPTAQPDATAKPRRKAPIRSSSDAEVQRLALEKRIQFLEQSISAEKERRAAMAKGEKSASNAELVERLMKLPTEAERAKALDELGEERLKTFTLAELAKLCPKMFGPPDGEVGKKIKDNIARTYETVSARLAILESVDQSGMSEEERKLHAEYTENEACVPGLFEKMAAFDSYDVVTWGEQLETIQSLISAVKRHSELASAEMKMLFSQAAKSLDVPDEREAGLIATLDEISEMTDLQWQDVAVGPLLWY